MSMDGPTSKEYQLVEEKQFTDQLLKLENIRYVDEALATLSEALRKNPGKFKIVAGTQHLRMARTDEYERNDIVVPPLRVYFVIAIENDIKYVRLKYIETIEYDSDY